MARLTTYYDTLQDSRTASESVIRGAYRALSQKYHPDKNPKYPDWAHRNMEHLNEAYNVLSDPARRAKYDSRLAKHEAAHFTAINEEGRSHRAQSARSTGAAPPNSSIRPGAPATKKNHPQQQRAQDEPPAGRKRTGSPVMTIISMAVGGFLGSHIGITGFGSAISGAIPGVIAGAIFPMWLKRKAAGLLGGATLSQAESPLLRGKRSPTLISLCMVVGGILGSSFGIAGFGSAISGAVPGIIAGAFLGVRYKRKASCSTGLAVPPKPVAASQTKPLSKFAMTIAAILFVGWIFFGNRPKLTTTTSALPPRAAVNSSPSSVDQRGALDASFEAAVARLEQQYPQVNPRSPLYDKQTANRITSLFSLLVDRGLSPSSAIESATISVISGGALAAKPVQSRAIKETAADRAERQRQIYEAADNLGTHRGY